MKILVITTSPHRGGNSDSLAAEFARGAQEAGNEVEIVSLIGKEINFCRGCLACQKTLRCVIRDDADAIREKMLDADVIAWATPVYYYSVSGQMKTMMDRTNPLYAADYRFRDVYLLASAAEYEPGTVEGTVKTLQGWVDCFVKARLAGVVFADGVSEKGDIAGHTALLQAYEMGKSVREAESPRTDRQLSEMIGTFVSEMSVDNYNVAYSFAYDFLHNYHIKIGNHTVYPSIVEISLYTDSFRDPYAIRDKCLKNRIGCLSMAMTDSHRRDSKGLYLCLSDGDYYLGLLIEAAKIDGREFIFPEHVTAYVEKILDGRPVESLGNVIVKKEHPYSDEHMVMGGCRRRLNKISDEYANLPLSVGIHPVGDIADYHYPDNDLFSEIGGKWVD